MNKRFYELRECLGVSQEDIGQRIGVTKSTISLIERGQRNPSDRVIRDICREFNVSEVWLRTGEGGEKNMFSKISSEDRYSLNLGKLTTMENIFIQSAINALAESEPEKLKIVEEFMKKCLGIE